MGFILRCSDPRHTVDTVSRSGYEAISNVLQLQVLLWPVHLSQITPSAALDDLRKSFQTKDKAVGCRRAFPGRLGIREWLQIAV
jgi:hypothetical protein